MKRGLSNQEIADLLNKFADTLEVYAENPYRVRAYRRAARTIIHLDQSIYLLNQKEFDLTSIPNIGKGIAKQVKEIIKTNKMPEIIRYQKKDKPISYELFQISGLGKKRILQLAAAGITTIETLQNFLKKDDLSSKFSWLTESFIEKLLPQLEHPKPYEKFLRFNTAELIINYIQNQLASNQEIFNAIPASAYRRKAELIGNVDWIIAAENNHKVIQFISDLNIVKEIVKHDENSISVILHSSLLMTFYVFKPANFASALLFYTGSRAHIEALQNYAKQQQLDLQLCHFEHNKTPHGTTEKEIYHSLGLEFIEPELRENRGEILAAEKNQLPRLITLDDIKGDLHSHTNETDGVEPLERMVEAAIELGYEYFAITDHSKKLAITNGLDEKRLLNQIEKINELNSRYPRIRILKSIEVDILEDGSLDLSNDVLKELDIRVCSIHSKFRIPIEKQTERIIRAMDNPYFNILGHMTGRLITSRTPYELHIEEIFLAAKERGCFIELNAQPSRLDINDIYCKQAKEMGVKISISSDAHSIRELSFMKFGINQARRGWIEKEDVINTKSLSELLKLAKRN